MKITNIVNANERFKNIKTGEFFIYDNDYYMRIFDSFLREKSYNAIDLRDGKLQYIPSYKSIIKLKDASFEGINEYIIPNPTFMKETRIDYLMKRDPGEVFFLLGNTYIVTDTHFNDNNILCVNLKTWVLTALNKYHLVINLTDSVEFKAVN